MSSVSRALRGNDWALALRESLPQAPGNLRLWMEQHTRLLKSDIYSAVGLLEVQEQTCFMKLYAAKSPLQSLGYRLGFGRGIHSFDAATRLSLAGLKVPEPRACLLVTGGLLLLTEGFGDGRDLRALWLARPEELLALQYLQLAGETLAGLHRAGFAHGDCKWSNLLWCGESFYLVDLEDVRRVRTAGTVDGPFHAWQLQDLARFTADAEALGASAGQFETFLGSYCGGANDLQEKLLNKMRPLVGAIRKRHQKKYGHRYEPLL